MKKLRLAFVVLAAAAFLVCATSALAILPTISTLPGETEPVEAHSEQKGSESLETEKPEKHTLTMTLEDLFLNANGSWRHMLTGVQFGEAKCKTGTEPAGTVVIKGTAQPVFRSLKPLTVGILYTLEETNIECEKLKIKVRGTALSPFSGELNVDITKFKGALKGSKGKPEITEYENEKGEITNAKLEANFNKVFETADFNAEKEAEYTIKTGMIIVNG